MTPPRALALLSGGLDSALSVTLLTEQGIEVLALHLESPTACRADVHRLARELGVRLEVRSKGEEYLRILRHPRWGYGKNMNPCIDCRVFMFRIAREFLDRKQADFVVTGEVAGQRPMSQGKNTLTLIDREAGLAGRVLRPLSALLLPETEPERRGWVDRSRLLGISGRGRTEQLALAERRGLSSYQSPGGGCLLTDAHFSSKLRDLFAHVPESATSMRDVALLRIGRHFRIRDDLKIVLGRNEAENRRLSEFADPGRWLVEPHGFHGPSALVCGPAGEESVVAALRLIAAYTKDPTPAHEVRWREGDTQRTRRLGAWSLTREAIAGSSPEGEAEPASVGRIE